MMTELNHCPFCGGKHIKLFKTWAFGPFWLSCEDCLAIGPDGATEDEAIQLWNKRPEVQG